MLVGLNYPFPWNAYGTYFGAGRPPGSSPELGAWLSHLRKNVAILRDDLGLGTVRIFLLCNLANYGTGRGQCWKVPETAPPQYLEHLEEMLGVFADAGVSVIPSLIDFKALGRRARVRGVENGCLDRHDLVSDATQRAKFLNGTFLPMLEVSTRYRDAIFAWEIINEPVWNTLPRPMPRGVAGGRTLSFAALRSFLREALELVESRGFRSTVGHRFRSDQRLMPTGTTPQFHFYPSGVRGRALLDRRLPYYIESRAILGEFGVQPSHGHQGTLWPELRGADAGSTRKRVVARLEHVHSRGYPLCLIWPDGIDGRSGRTTPPGPDPLQLSDQARRGVVDYMRTHGGSALPRWPFPGHPDPMGTPHVGPRSQQRHIAGT